MIIDFPLCREEKYMFWKRSLKSCLDKVDRAHGSPSRIPVCWEQEPCLRVMGLDMLGTLCHPWVWRRKDSRGASAQGGNTAGFQAPQQASLPLLVHRTSYPSRFREGASLPLVALLRPRSVSSPRRPVNCPCPLPVWS